MYIDTMIFIPCIVNDMEEKNASYFLSFTFIQRYKIEFCRKKKIVTYVPDPQEES